MQTELEAQSRLGADRSTAFSRRQLRSRVVAAGVTRPDVLSGANELAFDNFGPSAHFSSHPVKLPNLLATRNGRLLAFFSLYLTEGIPLGFTAVAIATQMRRQGLGPAEIGAFVGTLYLPWAFKWVMGPIVDVISSDRFGRRRTWIVLTQALMTIMLLAAMPVDFTAELKLFTFVIMAHNFFCATQDVASDALACNVLTEKERGLANGLMFGGAYLGQAIGGAGVLFLIPHTGIPATYVFVAAVILSVTVFVVLPMKEPRGPPRPAE
jgi:MFS transporter, PAT family, beta-lactamase induction signal transducer AmpG